MKSIVIDVDGTICDAIDRNYQEAVPIQPVIDKINFLYNQGYRIILYSSRGMHSCNGDLSLIIEKNHSTLKSWLENHKVKFHELIFGKPLADWYVDDKSLPVEDFVSAPFYELKGGSGESVRREANRVLKTGKSSKMQYDWYSKVKDHPQISAHIPEIYGFTVDTLYMEYIESSNAQSDPSNFVHIVKFIESLSDLKMNTHCNLAKYCNNILAHVNEDWTRAVCDKIMSLEKELKSHESFCHGDPTLANCLLTADNFYIIDPVYKDDFNSYLIDFSKLRMSLNGFEENLNLHSQHLASEYLSALQQFDEYLSSKGILHLVKLLEIANWIRLHNFRKGEEQEFAYNKSKFLWETYEK